MEIRTIPCGTLKVHAGEMHNHLDRGRITAYYDLDREGFMRIGMNAPLVVTRDQVVLFDPGCADFLPSRFVKSYGLEIPVPMEQTLQKSGYTAEMVTDVIFTHLHFDHGSGAFMRRPGMICKRFPNARYHVLREHYQYALKPEKQESSSFTTAFFKYLDKIHWLEDWNGSWMKMQVFSGHTRAMVVPGFEIPGRRVWYAADLIPMESFLEADVNSGYDLDPPLALKEKVEFLKGLKDGSEIIFFHDPLKDRKIYP